jgi:hypothetical protein
MVCWVRYALVGPCAKASDVAATDAVVAREITRLRKKERENNTIFTSEQVQPLRAWTSTRQRVPRYLSWKTRPKKLPTQIRHREWLKHGDRIQSPQLKIDLGFSDRMCLNSRIACRIFKSHVNDGVANIVIGKKRAPDQRSMMHPMPGLKIS